MKYKWHDVGLQEKCIRKVCFLGLWQLEVKEVGWTNDDEMLVKCQAYLWSDTEEEYLPVNMRDNKPRKYKNYGKGCRQFMEDWYAEHVILPNIAMGKDDKR